MVSPNSDAVLEVTAFDKNGNQLPFYTGPKTAPVLAQSDGSTDDGILLVDLAIQGGASDFHGVVYEMLTEWSALGDYPCLDANIPGLPDGTVGIRIGLRQADSSGNGVMFAPYGWDVDLDGVIPKTDHWSISDPVTSGAWAVAFGRSPRHDSTIAIAPTNPGRFVLYTPGQTIYLGWGSPPVIDFQAEGDAIVTVLDIVAAATSTVLLYAPKPIRLAYTCTAAGAGSLTSDLYAVNHKSGVVFDDLAVDSDTFAFAGAGTKTWFWDIPAGHFQLKLSAITANMNDITIELLPIE